MNRVNKLAAGMLLMTQTLSGAAFAASVTLAGSTVDFTFDDDLLGLFGPASVAGDTLFFTPTAFDAQSLNGMGFALTNKTLSVRVAAHDGYEFDALNLVERGDYLLLGTGGMVDVSGQIRALDLANPLTDITAGIVTTAALTTLGTPMHNWTATAMADVSALDARAINVTIQNLLLASTTSGGSLAFIEKKFAGLSIETTAVTPVPEAETWAMMLVGLGLVGWAARRRTRTSRNPS